MTSQAKSLTDIYRNPPDFNLALDFKGPQYEKHCPPFVTKNALYLHLENGIVNVFH